MTESVRAFLAIELIDEVKGALAHLVEELRRAEVRGLRPVKPEGMHLTLKFLGDVPRAQVELLVAEVSRVVVEVREFAVELGGVGVFPDGTAPRVLWVGVEGDLTSLRLLHRCMEEALQGLAYGRERRDFSPHLTLARISDRAPSAERRRAREALSSAGWEPGLRVDVEAVSLIRSVLLPQGARYQRLALMPLAGVAAQEGTE